MSQAKLVYRPTPNEPLSETIVHAVADTLGVDPVDLEDRISDCIDPDALDRLEDAHRSVIGAAHDNLAGTHQVHRAILRMLDPLDFGDFLRDLGGDVAHILRVDHVRLVLESAQMENDAAVDAAGDVLSVAEPGFIKTYLTGQRDISARQVTLRQIEGGHTRVYGRDAARLRSEACLLLDFGETRLPGLLVMGSEDAHQFGPQQGTDLLAFFAGVFERSMRRWLA